MHPEPSSPQILQEFKHELQKSENSSKLENLAAALLGKLLDVPIVVAQSGFQHGGDAGPSGYNGRRFRLECKKYSDNTSLSERELLGELDQALSRDSALEAWILITTRAAPEQIQQALNLHGERLGVPVVILDWPDVGMPSLAALCASFPELADQLFSAKLGKLARSLQSDASTAVSRLRIALQSWCLGYNSLRAKSHERLYNVWTSPRQSRASFAQDSAGGAVAKKVRRQAVHDALSTWWGNPEVHAAPVALIGLDGVGKTWAALDWLIDRMDEQPIVILVPSSALNGSMKVSTTNVKQIVSELLYDVAGVRDSQHWMRRFERLLSRPIQEGPVLTLFFDGLNQEPTVEWMTLFKVLQGEPFWQKIRIIISVRTHYFTERLANLRSLYRRPSEVLVEPYSLTTDGEFDQMLAFENLTRNDIPHDLIDLARRPRLFNLVVKLRSQVGASGHYTVHSLLWEYGRDDLGERAGKSFSNSDWIEWLKEVASRYLEGARGFSRRSLEDTVARPGLTPAEIEARLSDIVDGRFVLPGPAGVLQLDPTIIAHALGMALLSRLQSVDPQSFEIIDAEQAKWLDPIAGMDQRDEIIRAAIWIMVHGGNAISEPVAGVLITAWLHTQNVTELNRQEQRSLANILPGAFFDALEQSSSRAYASAQQLAVSALRALPRTDAATVDLMVSRIRSWFCIISRDAFADHSLSAKYEGPRLTRLQKYLGTDSLGPSTVLGVELQIVRWNDDTLRMLAPALLKGSRLQFVLPVFKAAAIGVAIEGYSESWDGIKWLCLMNEIDADETARGLRSLANEMLLSSPEPGVRSELSLRVAAHLLRLTAREQDELDAVELVSDIAQDYSYERDYLPCPSDSLFALERRHAQLTLADTNLSVERRVQRTKELWNDPTFEPTPEFVQELRTFLQGIKVDHLYRHRARTVEEHKFEEILPAAARCAPDLLVVLAKRWLLSLTDCPEEARYWTALRVQDYLLLIDEPEAGAVRTLRQVSAIAENDMGDYASSLLLTSELIRFAPVYQFAEVLKANLESIPLALTTVLGTPTSSDVDNLITQVTDGSPKQKRDLLALLSQTAGQISESAWDWVADIAAQEDPKIRHLAFMTLARIDSVRLGRLLIAIEWSWRPQAKEIENHYGSRALIMAASSIPFDQLAMRVAPWCLLEAARERGSDPSEVRLAAEIFGQVLSVPRIEVPDLEPLIAVNRTHAKSWPLQYSLTLQGDFSDGPLSITEATQASDARQKRAAIIRMVDIAVERIEAVRRSGAVLFVGSMDPRDFEPVLRHAPDLVASWLVGSSERSGDFRRRLGLAESAYMALCEALLAHNPPLGGQLWRILRDLMRTRFIGPAGIDDLLHMLFRVPDSAVVMALREEVIEIEHCHSDRVLFNVSVAAAYNGKGDWLSATISEGRASPLVWMRKRAELISGYTVDNNLPVDGAWPEGQIITSNGDLMHYAARNRWIEACSRHWWSLFLNAENSASAYAAWILFLRSADERAWVWIHQDANNAKCRSQHYERKTLHYQVNYEVLIGAMKERSDKYNGRFLNRNNASLKFWLNEE